MDWKPTKRRVILALLLFIALLFATQIVQENIFRVYDAPQNYGFPFTYLTRGGSMTPVGYNEVNEFHMTGLAGNLLVWAAIAYFLSILFLRLKK